LLRNKKSEFLFPTQVAIADIENFKDFQDDLVKWIYEYKKKDSGISRISNKGGWQSLSKEVFNDEGFAPFQPLIVETVKELLLEFNIARETTLVQMWLNINGPNSYNVSHRHPNVELAGVLWIKQTPEQGRFVFDNMDIGYRDAMLINATDREHLEKYKMPPEYVPKYSDGTICIFPANLTHRVEINETKEDRISISFNIKIS
tara:strand:- start:92 stop:700 length:609 start_codon:yes stop_codon:yes gene_type:complete